MITAKKIMLLIAVDTDRALIEKNIRSFDPNTILIIAHDKISFLEKIEWFLPDIILCDIDLDGYSGMEALIYAKINKPTVPFVLMSVRDGFNPMVEQLTRVADGLIFKDDLSELPLQLERVLNCLTTKASEYLKRIEEENWKMLRMDKAVQLLHITGNFPAKNQILKLLMGNNQGTFDMALNN